MTLRQSLKVSLVGIVVEAVGLLLDILHHLSIGIETPEGLLSYNHAIIFVGFVITSVGVIISLRKR